MRIAVLALVLVGCGSAQMVSGPGRSGSPYAPVNEAQRGGVVKYLNQGAGFIVQNRREDAYKQMHQACGGSYRIDAEGPHADAAVTQVTTGPLGATAYTQSMEYWYIRFSCVSAVAAR